MRRLRNWRWHGAGLAAVGLLIAALVVPFVLAAPSAQGGETLRIGYLGQANSDGANGVQLAIDEINAGGGVTVPDGTTYRLELVTLDVTPTAGSLAENVAELMAQNVTAIFGPDGNDAFAGNIPELVSPGIPVLTAATIDGLTDTDASNTIFRIRAPEHVYSFALATYLTTDLGLTSIALIQTDVVSTEALASFEGALNAAGLQPADRIQIPSGGALTSESERLLNVNPEAVVLWGPPQDAANLLVQLRSGGWAGQFAYRYADEAAREGVLPDELANGVLGVDSWSYGYKGRLTRFFLRDYVTTFGKVPGPLSAASYDAMWYLWWVIRDNGVDPATILGAMLTSPSRPVMQGTMHPADFGNGDLARFAMVYELGPRGGPTVVARFDDTQTLPIEDAGQEVAELPTPVPPTNTPGPPTETPVPTATQPGTWVTVTANTLNVRNGSGLNFDKIGEVKLGDQLRLLGVIADYTWSAVDFQGGVGWIKTEYTELSSGSLADVSIIQAPPSPTPIATATPTLPPNPDIVIDTVVLQPTKPIPGKPFTATVTVRNAGGGAAGRFAVAGTFEPGSVFTSTHVEGLAGGQTAQAQLTGTLAGTGVFQVAIVADLNKEVPEVNEDNNNYLITYHADYPNLAEQTGLQISATTTWDLQGGTPDFEWDGYNLAMRNGSMIGVLSGMTYENAHYDALSPAVVSNGTGFGSDKVTIGAVFGMYTAEGKRAVLRVDNLQAGSSIWLSYRVYNDTP